MESNKVTVYITNYNYGEYIEQSIKSVLNQTYQNYELLIIDDGSTDDSKSVIEKYRDSENVRIIYQKNKGLNITNNIAMRLAKGDYIVRLDADDYWMPKFLEIMVDKIESDPNLGLVFPDYYYVNAVGEVTGVERRFNFEEEVSLYDLPAHGACTLIRLKFLKDLGGYNESFACQDGYDLWLKFVNNHDVVNVNEPLFYYRRHGNNLTNNEDRILNTRKAIKKTYLTDAMKQIPRTVAIIPVRSQFIENENWPLFSTNGKTILDKKVDMLKQSNYIHKIVITTSEDEMLLDLKLKYASNQDVEVIKRPESYSQFNESLVKTHKHILSVLASRGTHVESILTVSLDYPFVDLSAVEDLLHTMVIFKTDSVISVRPNNLTHYKHTGSGLKTILNQEKFTKFERDALYTGAGGLILTKKELLDESDELIAGRIGHVIVNKKASLRIDSAFNFELFQLLSEKEYHESVEVASF